MTVVHMNKSVVLGMSGGVDSSYAASLLKNNGYEVIGAYCIMHEYAEEGLQDAKRVAESLNIELHAIDLTEIFDKTIKKYFTDAYSNAKTPNPCIVCNPTVKFKALCDLADKLGAEKIATGHYAGTGFDEESGRYYIKKASYKDQSYMLCRLTQEQISRVLFPLYGTEKDDNRKAAALNGIPLSDKPDSQEICFIPDKDYARFIENRIGRFPEGEFWIEEEDRAVGIHKGLIHYTIGQRKNLGIALGERIYVKGFDIPKNRVILSRKDVTDNSRLTCQDIIYQALAPETVDFQSDVKIRYAHKGAQSVSVISEGKIRTEFIENQRAVTPGQYAVYYHGDKLLCAGEITNNN